MFETVRVNLGQLKKEMMKSVSEVAVVEERLLSDGEKIIAEMKGLVEERLET